jgi:hypothetical protein
MSPDPCMELVTAVASEPRFSPLQRLVAGPLQRLGLTVPTPHERIAEAVKKEILDLSQRSEQALERLKVDDASARSVEVAQAALRDARGRHVFPRRKLKKLSKDGEAPAAVRAEVSTWVERHQKLERRLRWLLDPRLTRDEIGGLDARADADQIWCSVRYEFRPEVLYALWGNAIERISQIEATATFFHSTGKAEGIPVKRTEDTALFYAYLFNWGSDSYHGRKAVEGMNRIHGRYFIHNDGLKYVLLNAAFTILDGLDAIGHRPLTEKERLGYFHAQVEMGKAMNIQDLDHSWDRMYDWFHGLNRAFADATPHKIRSWQTIEDEFDRHLRVPSWLSRFRKAAERASMDDTYLSALGLERPSRGKTSFVRGVFGVVNRARNLLPREPYIQSLHSYNSYPGWARVEEIGEKERSERMPSACPFRSAQAPRPNRGYPENQKPLVGVEHAAPTELDTLTWDEVVKHDREDDLWLVWGGHVYDVSAFARHHPGTLKVLLNGVGRDMTRPFEKAKHTDLTRVFALNFRIGKIEDKAAPPRAKRRKSEALTASS